MSRIDKSIETESRDVELFGAVGGRGGGDRLVSTRLPFGKMF